MPPSPALIKLGSAMHLFWLRVSGGRLWGTIQGAPILVLTTTGRKSGKPRTTPLLYLENDGAYVIVASFGGHPRHPAWFLNLRENPEAEIETRDQRMRVRAEVAGVEERARLWPKLVEMYKSYQEYQQRTEREIPVVRLRVVEWV